MSYPNANKGVPLPYQHLIKKRKLPKHKVFINTQKALYNKKYLNNTLTHASPEFWDTIQTQRLGLLKKQLKTSKEVLIIGSEHHTELCEYLVQQSCKTTVLNISSLWIEKQKKQNPSFSYVNECLPYTSLADKKYDLILCNYILGHLPDELHRFTISELHRILSVKGRILISSSFDIDTQDTYPKLKQLLSTEFKIEKNIPFFFSCSIRIFNYLKLPRQLSKACVNVHYRTSKIKQHTGLRKILFVVCGKWVSLFFKGLSNTSKYFNHLMSFDTLYKYLPVEASHTVDVISRKDQL